MISAILEALLAVQLAIGLGVLVVLALRRAVRQLAGARLAFGLWALPVIAGLAVMAPGPFYSDETVTPARVAETAPFIEAEASIPMAPGDDVAKPVSPDGAVELGTEMASQGLEVPAVIWLALWGTGILATAAVLGVRQYRFQLALRPMKAAPELGPDVFRAGSPHVGAGLVGAAKPRIIVPADFEARFNPAEIKLILEHEREHRRAGHAQFNAVAALVLVLCWMNPLVHLGLRWFRLDQELACDAAILERSQKSARTYGAALLRAQTGVAAPFGCTWRPANGLSTRIKALGSATPAALQRGLGAVGLTVLIMGVGTASWAMRPEMQATALASDPINDEATRAVGEGAQSDLVRLIVRGVDARVAIIAENRDDIVVEGLPAQILTRREGDTMILQVSELTRDVCNQSFPVTQDFTLRVPEGVHVDIEGRMDVTLTAPADISVRAHGCGSVDLGDVSGALTLDLGGNLVLDAQRVAGPLTLNATGAASVDLVHVDGPIAVRTSSGVTTRIETLEAGGWIDLSGGSEFEVEEWNGELQASLSGGSDARIETITAPWANVTVAGSSTGDFEAGMIGTLSVDQAARAAFVYGGRAERSRVDNRGDVPVVIASPGELESRGQVRTRIDPPGG